MINSTMGLKKIYIAAATGSADANTGYTFPVAGAAWNDLGDVYKDSCTLVDDDPEETSHESETSSKVITLSGKTNTNVTLQLMDPDLEQLARYFGGTITTVGSKKAWIRPRKLPYKEWAIKLMPEEGVMVQCANVRITPKFNITYSATGICLVDLTIKLQAQLCMDETAADPTKTT